MVLFQVNDFAAFDVRLNQQKLRKVWQINRPEVCAAHVHPKDISGAIVSFDEMRPADEWIWAGPGWRERRARHATSIVGCEVGAVDPDALCRRWAEVLDVVPRKNTLQLDGNTYVSFTEANRDGVQKAIIATPTPDNMNERAAALGLGAVLNFVAEM